MTYFTMLLISDMYSIAETLTWGSEHLSFVLVTVLRQGGWDLNKAYPPLNIMTSMSYQQFPSV